MLLKENATAEFTTTRYARANADVEGENFGKT
jgi:hypothetical protein